MGSELIDCKSFAGRQVAFLQSSSRTISSVSKCLESSLLLIPLATRPVAGLRRPHRRQLQALISIGK